MSEEQSAERPWGPGKVTQTGQSVMLKTSEGVGGLDVRKGGNAGQQQDGGEPPGRCRGRDDRGQAALRRATCSDVASCLHHQ